MEPIIDLLLGYLIRKGIEFAESLMQSIIRHVHRKIKARLASKSGDKSGTGCPNAGIKITYNVHYYPPCTHSGKTARRRRGRSARRRSLR